MVIAEVRYRRDFMKDGRMDLMARVIAISIFVVLMFVGTAMGEVSREGPVAEWHFDEGTGNIVKDSSGNGNDGIIYSATWVDGKFGKALSFDGVDDYVDVTGPTGTFNELTIETWVKINQYKEYGKIVDFAKEDKNINRFTLQTNSNGIDFTLNGGNSGNTGYTSWLIDVLCG